MCVTAFFQTKQHSFQLRCFMLLFQVKLRLLEVEHILQYKQQLSIYANFLFFFVKLYQKQIMFYGKIVSTFENSRTRAKVYLGPWKISLIHLFCENSGLMPLIIYVNVYELHYRYFTGIKIRLYVAVLKNNRSGKFYNILRKYKLALLAIRSHSKCLFGNSANLFDTTVFLSRRSLTEMCYLRDNIRKTIPYHIFLPKLYSQHQLGSAPLSHDRLFGTINTMM